MILTHITEESVGINVVDQQEKNLENLYSKVAIMSGGGIARDTKSIIAYRRERSLKAIREAENDEELFSKFLEDDEDIQNAIFGEEI